jgi:hypothetical protein
MRRMGASWNDYSGGGNSKEVQFVFPTRCKMAELHSSVAAQTMH